MNAIVRAGGRCASEALCVRMRGLFTDNLIAGPCSSSPLQRFCSHPSDLDPTEDGGKGMNISKILSSCCVAMVGLERRATLLPRPNAGILRMRLHTN